GRRWRTRSAPCSCVVRRSSGSRRRWVSSRACGSCGRRRATAFSPGSTRRRGCCRGRGRPPGTCAGRAAAGTGTRATRRTGVGGGGGVGGPAGARGGAGRRGGPVCSPGWRGRRVGGAARNRFLARLDELARLLTATRPTAVNLRWALDRMARVAAETPDSWGGSGVWERLQAEATAIWEEDRAMCRRIGEAGLPVIPDGAKVVTHCNAGALATGGIGTALEPP